MDRQKQMAAYAFTSKRIQEGNDLLKNAALFQNQKKHHYNERWAILQQLKTDWQKSL